MDNILRKLKSVLDGLSEEELDNYDLWVDNKNTIDIIAVDDNAISLITDSKKLTNRRMYLVK